MAPFSARTSTCAPPGFGLERRTFSSRSGAHAAAPRGWMSCASTPSPAPKVSPLVATTTCANAVLQLAAFADPSA
eukprot:15432104-Alexandrium_andersonii.AAC.1